MKEEAKDILAKCLKKKGCTNNDIHIIALMACVDAMEIYARKKNQELQLLVNILTPNKTLKCSCEEPKPNYPEMVWCDKCGYEMPNVKYCTCSLDPKCRIKSNKVYCNYCNLERK